MKLYRHYCDLLYVNHYMDIITLHYCVATIREVWSLVYHVKQK